jgi:DNA-binding transcriptional regulator YiaG
MNAANPGTFIHIKNTLKMNKVKTKHEGRPRRSDGGVNLKMLGARIRQVRGATTQQAFCKLLDISQAQLSKYELGQTAPPFRVIIDLAAKFDRTTDWLLTGK